MLGLHCKTKKQHRKRKTKGIATNNIQQSIEEEKK